MAHATIIAALEGQEAHLEVEVEIGNSERGIVGSGWKSAHVCLGIE